MVWIHGPQEYRIGSAEEIRQRLERRPEGPVLYEIQTKPGSDELVEKLDGLKPVRHVALINNPGGTVAELLNDFGKSGVLSIRRESRVVADMPEKQSTHIVRLWAYNTILDDCTSGDPVRVERACERGIRYSLVTPVTGAVVLETERQFKEAGLEPVPIDTVPTVPEPEMWLLLICAGGIILVGITVKVVRGR